MSWLLIVGLKNTFLALPLAAFAWAAGRWFMRPGLAHLLWAVVLLKLLTPPVVEVPLGWRLNIESWLGAGQVENPVAAKEAVQAHASARSVQPLFPPATGAEPPSVFLAQRRTRHLPRSEERDARPATSSALSSSLLVSGWSWRQGLGAVWLAGSLCVGLLFLVCAWRFRRFVRGAAVRDHELAARVGELAAMTGLGVPPRVVVVDGVVSPMLWGLGGSVRIVFPRRLAERLTAAELDSLLLHELAHYARGDCWVRLLEMLAVAFYWWNPLVWLALREIEAAEEECCDAWVIRRQRGARHSYAEALLATIDFLCERPVSPPPAACGLGQASLLKARLLQIMRGDPTPRLSRTMYVAVLILGIVVSPLEPALWATSTRTFASRGGAAQEIALSSPPRQMASASAESFASLQAILAPPAPALATAAPSSRVAQQLPAMPSLWATAVSPDGQFRLEARTGRKTTLMSVGSQFRLDMSAHRITCVSFAPASTIFATGHEDALVRLWDSDTGGLIQSLPRRTEAAITSIQFSPNGRHIAAGARDGGVRVWDVATGDEIARLALHDTPVSCLRWSSLGDHLAITFGSWSDASFSSLVIWSPVEDAIVLEEPLTEPAGALAWTDDGQTLVIAAWSGEAVVWNVAARQPVARVQLEKDRVSAAAWSPDCPLGVEVIVENAAEGT